MRNKVIFENHFLTRILKYGKFIIRPANDNLNGLMKLFIKGADKNHNPRKGTETFSKSFSLGIEVFNDKNHNPRKGTETALYDLAVSFFQFDKNHNPRKGTETLS